MASISPTTFPYARSTADQNHHKLTHTSKFTSTRLNRSSYLSTLFPHSLSRVSDSSAICRCHNNNDADNNNDNDGSSRRWDSAFQESVRNAIKWFDEYRNGAKKDEDEDEDEGSDGDEKREGEMVMDDDRDYEWDWERWKKHFTEIDEQERVVSILKSQLNRAVLKEDFEDAARIKVAIAAAATNDTVGRAMSHLNKAIEEERYRDAAFVRDYASAGLVGWWAGLSDDSNDPYGRIIHISAEHGRYLARSYTPRQLEMAADGAPLFEIFLTMNKKGEYRHQAVYLKPSEVPHDFPMVSSKSSSLTTSVNDLVGDGDLFAVDIENMDDSEDRNDDSDMTEESIFENFLRDMIPGAKDLKFKGFDVTAPVRLDMDLISEGVEQRIEEENEEDASEAESTEAEDEVKDGTDEEQNDNDVDANNRMIDIGRKSQITLKVDLVLKTSKSTSREDLVRVPADLEKKGRSSFSFHIEKEKKQISSTNPKSQSLTKREMRIRGDRSIDSVLLVLAKSIGRGKISMKVLKDLSQLLNISLNQTQNRKPLSGSTTFNRIELPATADPLNGLYVGAHGLYTSEVIHLRRKFGQWQEDGSMKELSNLEFYEYVEAVKLTGDPNVPAGQVAFRAKVGTKYQLPHKGIIPEEFGVIARYRGQGRLAEPGFRNPRWVDGELVILDGKYIKGGPVVGFVYWAPEYHFLVFFNQLRLQD